MKILFLLLSCVLIAGCHDRDDIVADHVHYNEYRINNASDIDLLVGLQGSIFQEFPDATIAVPAKSATGETFTSWYFRDIAEAVWCVSIRNESTGLLIRQICPATDEDWTTERIDQYRRRYTLTLDAAILAAAPDTCPVLDGRVVDAATGEGIERVSVVLHGSGGVGTLTNGTGEYSLPLRAGLPSGYLEFTKSGYARSVAEVMTDLEADGNFRYSLETRLQLEDR